ncbi:MAG TPA: hypothetical protein VFV03_05040 [Solirubrobacteraceae bacterium]|nr:hypothetical protein [Solirubrobacteraceae bacterium]
MPRSADIAAPEAFGLPLVVTGGQTEAHAPEQPDEAPLSPENMYTVNFFEPAARIVPSLLECLTAIVTAAPDAGVVVAAAVELRSLVVGVVAATDAELEDLLELPQPAASRADAPSTAIRQVVGVFMKAPTVVGVA